MPIFMFVEYMDIDVLELSDGNIGTVASEECINE